MKKVFKKIHLWLSIPFGLIITLICFSGAMLVFEQEVMELSHKDLYRVRQSDGEPIPVDRLLAKVALTLPDSVSVTGVSIPSDPGRAYQVNLSKPRRASVYVDQYTGEIKGQGERAAFFTFMFRLHRWLLDSRKPGEDVFVGRIVVGTGTLMFVFVLLSGAVIWVPRTAKALKNRLLISTGKGRKRFWYDLHVAGGMYALLFLLAMSLTGLTWSFAWYRTGFYKAFGVATTPESGHNAYARESKKEKKPEGRGGQEKPAPFAHWQEVYEQLRRDNPQYKQITLSDGTASVSFRRPGNQRASDRYTFNPRNGEITGTTLYKDSDRSGKIRGWIYSVHTGGWGGLFTRLLSFVAALIGASLPLTGYYLWIKRKSRARGEKKGTRDKSVDNR